MHTWVSVHITTVALALVCHALVADSEKAREETSLVGGKDNTEKFGPLKSVLGKSPHCMLIVRFAYNPLH